MVFILTKVLLGQCDSSAEGNLSTDDSITSKEGFGKNVPGVKNRDDKRLKSVGKIFNRLNLFLDLT
jgi:hypothetical protein